MHSFEIHEHLACNSQNKIHFDTHEIDCSVFHFKINTNTIEFNSNFSDCNSDLNTEKVYAVGDQIISIKLQFKSSRAPPVLLT